MSSSISDNNKCSIHYSLAYSIALQSDKEHKKNLNHCHWTIFCKVQKLQITIGILDPNSLKYRKWIGRSTVYPNCQHLSTSYTSFHAFASSFIATRPIDTRTVLRGDTQKCTSAPSRSSSSTLVWRIWPDASAVLESRSFWCRKDDSGAANKLQHPCPHTLAVASNRQLSRRIHSKNTATRTEAIKKRRWRRWYKAETYQDGNVMCLFYSITIQFV